MHAKSTAIIMAVSVFLAVFAGIGISNGIPNQSAFSSNQSVSNHHSISKQLSEEINSTSGYIRTVNQSAYFFFYPDLADSYAYLNEANSIAPQNQSKAESLLLLARTSATQSLSDIIQYKEYAIFTLIIITLLSGFGMYRFMRVTKHPLKPGRINTSRAKVKE